MLNSKLSIGRFLPVVILFLFSLLISLPLLEKGLFFMHDDQQLARLFLLDKALTEGQFPVRWVSGLGFGFGYPLLNFYPPFIYYLAEIFHLASFSLVNSLKITIFLSIFLSGIAMYFFSKTLFQDKWAALIAAIFYTYVPYRAVDIYIRGALAESFAFVWTPLIFMFYLKLSKNSNVYLLLGAAFSVFLLIITHNISFLITAFVLALYLPYLIYQSKTPKKLFLQILGSIFISMCLSAFFWMPSLLEKKFTIVDAIFLATNYKEHFVQPSQLWNSPWGFGGSSIGIEDGLSFKLGKIYVITSIFAVLLAAILYVKKSQRTLAKKKLEIVIAIFLLLVTSVFMTTEYSAKIWQIIPSLSYIQFPWRFLLLAAMFSSVLVGAFVHLLNVKLFQVIGGGLLLITVVLLNTKLFAPQLQRPHYTDAILEQTNFISWDVSKLSFDFLPNGVSLINDEKGNAQFNISKEELPTDPVGVISGEAKINEIKTQSSRVSFSADVKQTSKLMINTFYFPGWTLYIDNIQTEIDSNNKLRLMSFNVSEGVHRIELIFKNTFIRAFSNIVSLSTIIFIIIFIIWKYKKISL